MAEFKFNAGKVGGVHVGTVTNADDLATKLEMSTASEQEKTAVMSAFADEQYQYMQKGKSGETKEKKGGLGKTLYDAVKRMAN
jgi:hypothetical protein